MAKRKSKSRKNEPRPVNPSVDVQKRLKLPGRGLIEIRALMLATEAIAQALAGWDERVLNTRKVRIFWTKKETPYVTPDFRICLPIPADINDDTVARLAMFRDHEVSHILYTNFDHVKASLDHDNGKGENMTAKNLHNAVEDIRIEAALGRIFAGCRANFLKFYKRNETELHESLLGRRSFVDQVGIACILWANDVKLPSNTPDITLRGLEVAKPFVKKVMDLSAEEEKADTTYRKSNKCFKYAMDLYDALKKFAEDNKDQFQSMESSDLQPGEEGEGEGEPGEGEPGEGSGKGSGKGKGKGSGGDGEAGEGNGGGKGGPSKGKMPEGHDDGHTGSGETNEFDPDWVFSTEDTDKVIGEIRAGDATMETDEDTFDKLDKGRGYYGGSNAVDDPTTGDRVIPNEVVQKIAEQIEGHTIIVDANHRHPQLAAMKQFAEATAGAAANLAKLLMGMDRRWTARRRLDGRVDDRMLAEAGLGTTQRCFQNVRRSAADSCVVTLLVDLSGSMGHDGGYGTGKLAEAKRACFALAGVCNRAKVKFEIHGYTDAGGGTGLFVAKEFNQPWSDETMARVANLNTHGSTPTGEATLLASRRLGRIRADRHILFVVTDGSPNDPQLNYEAIDTVRRGGVEVYGFGIQGTSESSLRDQYGNDGYVFCPSTALGLEGNLVMLLTKLLTPAMQRILARG